MGVSSPTNSFPSQHPTGPVANGFSGTPDGSFFLGVDAAFATAPISQSITGLTVGHTYTLSFDYAGAQFTDALGDNTEGWQVSFGTGPTPPPTVSTAMLSNVSQGFTGWKNFTTTLTAIATTETLSFLALGGPSGLPPFALLDGVSLTDNSDTPPPPAGGEVPEPSSVVMLGLGALGAVGVGVRRRQKAAKV